MTGRARRRRGPGRLLLALVLALVAAVAAAAPAAAHLDLASSEPAQGGVLDDPGAGLLLRFTRTATPSGSGFTVFDARGGRVPVTASSPDGGVSWRIRFAATPPAGTYGLRWRVVAGDAHPRTGTVTFEVAAGAAGPASPRPSASRSPASAKASPGHPAGHTDGSAHAGMPGSADGGSAALQAALHGEPGHAAPGWDGLGAVGRWLSFGGVLVAVGALLVVVSTLVGSRGDVRLSEQVVRVAAGAAVAGALLEALALVVTVGAAAPRQPVAAVALRLLGGAALVLCLRLLPRGSGGRRSRDVPVLPGTTGSGRRAAGTPVPTPAGVPGGVMTAQLLLVPPVRTERVRGVPTRPAVVGSLSLLLLASFVLDGHTAIVGPWPLVAAAALAHTAAAAVWVGGVVLLAVLLLVRARAGVPTGAGELAVRFSVPATAAVVVAGVAGTCLAVQILDGPGDLVGTPWGRVLLVKLGLVAVVALMGYANNRYALPALDAWRPGTARMLRRTVAAEAGVMVTVVLVTAVLVGAQS